TVFGRRFRTGGRRTPSCRGSPGGPPTSGPPGPGRGGSPPRSPTRNRRARGLVYIRRARVKQPPSRASAVGGGDPVPLVRPRKAARREEQWDQGPIRGRPRLLQNRRDFPRLQNAFVVGAGAMTCQWFDLFQVSTGFFI